MNRLRASTVPHWAAARQASADLFGFVEERLSGTEDIRASGATGYVMTRFQERSRPYRGVSSGQASSACLASSRRRRC
jgi:hypothetical protein